MQPFTDTDASFAQELRPYLGSFWTSRFGAPQQVNTLLGLTTNTKLLGSFRQVTANLMGDAAGAKLEKFVEEAFDPKAVVLSGQQMYDDPDFALLYQDPTDVLLSYNLAAVKYYILPVNKFIPRLVQGPNSKLILGLDFFVVQRRWLFFRQDPRTLFPDYVLRMHLAERAVYRPTNAYLLRASVQVNEKYITQYYRSKSTPKAFQLALAAVGGIAVIHYNQRLLGKRAALDETVYVFENETIRVGYPHTPLTVGQTYQADTLIGQGVQMFYDTGAGDSWWRAVPWGVGILLDPIMKMASGLPLLNRETVAYSAGSDAGSIDGNKLHARIKLSDDFYHEQSYWDQVSDKETRSGNYFNGLLGLPDDEDFSEVVTGYNYSTSPVLYLTVEDYGSIEDVPTASADYGQITDNATASEDYGQLFAEFTGAASTPIYTSLSATFAKLLEQYAAANSLNTQLGWPLEQPDLESLPNSKRVNALDAFFGATLQKKGLVIFIRRDQIPNLPEFYRFLSREMLAGVVPIVFSRTDSLEVEKMTIGSTMLVTESGLRLTPAVPLVLSEQVSLSAIMTDSVVFV